MQSNFKRNNPPKKTNLIIRKGNMNSLKINAMSFFHCCSIVQEYKMCSGLFIIKLESEMSYRHNKCGSSPESEERVEWLFEKSILQ